MKKVAALGFALGWFLIAAAAYAAPLGATKPLTSKTADRLYAGGHYGLCMRGPRGPLAVLEMRGETAVVVSRQAIARAKLAAKKLPAKKRKKALKRLRSASQAIKGCRKTLSAPDAERGKGVPPCVDINEDDVINSGDISAFLQSFHAGDGDFNLDGVTESEDISAFLFAFLGAVRGTYECQEPPPPPPTPTPTATPTPTPSIPVPSGEIADDECSNGIDDDGDGLIDAADNAGLTEGALGATFGCQGPNGQESAMNFGWTLFTRQPEGRVVYVSSSIGNDGNSGLSPSAPKRSLLEGYRMIRNGHPDWLLLRRGDTFIGEFLGAPWNNWEKSGMSAAAPIVIGSYGDPAAPRPLIKTGSNNGFEIAGGGYGSLTSFVSLVGIEFYAHTRNPNDPAFSLQSGALSYPTGVRYTRRGQHILVEDCKFSFFGLNLHFQHECESATVCTPLQQVKIRRNIVTDAYGVGIHSQGIYGWGVDGLLIEENVFDRNGYNDAVHSLLQTLNPPRSSIATMFNRNLYIAHSPNTIMRGNIDARGSSGGTQLRRGGTYELNLSLRNPSGIGMGHPQNVSGTTVEGIIRHNVILDSYQLATDPFSFGISIGTRVTSMQAYENIIAHNENGGGDTRAINFNADEPELSTNVAVYRNIIYKWARSSGDSGISARVGEGASVPLHTNSSVYENIVDMRTTGLPVKFDSALTMNGLNFFNNRYYSPLANGFRLGSSTYNHSGWVGVSGETGSVFAQGSFPDPERTIRSYMTSLGGTPTLDAFLQEARRLRKGAWRPAYTSRPVINYIREGFGRPPAP